MMVFCKGDSILTDQKEKVGDALQDPSVRRCKNDGDSIGHNYLDLR